MLDETRRNLDKATGELIESFVNFDKNKAMQVEIGLHAIHNAQKNSAPEKRINLYTVCDHDKLHKLLEEHGITRNEFEQIPAIIESKNPEHIECLSLPLKEAFL